MLNVQREWSALPSTKTLMAEVLTSREGTHLFLYPFAGRHVHLGLASLLAWRVAQQAPKTFSMAVNDYGFELLCADAVDWSSLLPTLITPAANEAALLQEVLESLNASELAQRRFREIARVAGLIFQSHPGEQRSSKQLQASSSLYWEVFRKYDPANRLLHQAQAELLSQELEIGRLRQSLARMATQTLVLKPLVRPTPFAFPLMVERLREKLSNEQVADRIARMLAQLEKAAGGVADLPAAAAVLENLLHGRDALADRASRRPARERKVSRPLRPL
jgi:ATP-dependent Lhr-like helicase